MAERKNVAGAGVILLLAATSYLDSPLSFLNKDYYIMSESPQEVHAWKAGDGRTVIEFEKKLVKTVESNGYQIEIWQEFELEKDSTGKIIKSTPTDFREEIKYKTKSNSAQQ